jgi:pantetheine-phosphate adenylyltransferase
MGSVNTIKQRLAVYAGSFDPPTNGHEWMIRESARMFDHVVVAIGVNPAKTPMFTTEERIEMLKAITKAFPNVSVAVYENMYLVDFAKEAKAHFIIRGIRSPVDYEFEHSMRDFNEDIGPKAKNKKITSVFLMPPAETAKISSSTVKSLVGPRRWRAVVKKYVSKAVLKKLKEKYHGKS